MADVLREGFETLTGLEMFVGPFGECGAYGMRGKGMKASVGEGGFDHIADFGGVGVKAP